MKSILRHYIIDTVSLYLVSRMASGMVFEKGMESLLLAGLALSIGTILIKPIINILLLPINLVTFGLFKWLSSAISFYIIILIVPGFKIVNFYFAGFATKWFEIPSFGFNGLMAFLAFSFLLSIIISLVHWLLK